MKCPLCGYEFDALALDCRQAGCPLAELQGCSLICCPNCGYQMPDQRRSTAATVIQRLQGWLAARAKPAGPGSGAGSLSVRYLKPGQSALVTELRFDDPDQLGQLCSYGLAPGSTVRLEQTQPVVILRIGGTTLSMDAEIASGILVQPD